MVPRPELHKCVTEQSLLSLLHYTGILHVKVLPWLDIAVASKIRICPNCLSDIVSIVWIDPSFHTRSLGSTPHQSTVHSQSTKPVGIRGSTGQRKLSCPAIKNT